MPADLSRLVSEAEALLPDAVALRREIHRDPELGLELPKTQARILAALEGLDLEVETGLAESGVVAVLRGAQPGPTILLRADMDALPLQEDTGLPFASEQAGRMHACGHDAHVAMLASAARLLVGRRDELHGNVKFVFQPGEEGHAGARIMIEGGLLSSEPEISAAFALHMAPTEETGTVLLRPGPILAATDVFSVELTGRGGHASMPQDTLDPIPAACELVLACQSLVTRRVDPFDPAVLSVTKVASGTTHNVIPESAQVLGTIRSVSAQTRERVHSGLKRVAQGVAAAHDLEAKVHLFEGYPVTTNDPAFIDFTRRVTEDVFGAGMLREMPAPIMGGEDFSYILEKVSGAIVFLGARPEQGRAEPLHSNRMCINESAMETGIAMHAAMALRYLSEEGA